MAMPLVVMPTAGSAAAMDYAARVRVGQRIRHVVQDPHDIARRKLHVFVERMPQRLTFDVRHREVQQVAGGTGGVQRHDVRMLELRGELDLAPEPLAVLARREVRGQDFDDDLPVQRLLGRHEHTAHAAAGQLAFQDVRVAKGGA